jgi:hypothetical protein
VSAPLRRKRNGTYALRLPVAVRDILANLAGQLEAGLDADDPATARLFPPAYLNEAHVAEEAGYQALVHGVLANHHRQALETMRTTAQATSLDEEQLQAWLSATASLRLVLGTRLGVSEDMDQIDPEGPDGAEHSIYLLLSSLQEMIVSVLAEDLPDEGRPEGSL